MLTPEEIKLRLDQKKKTQTDVAQEIGISRSELCTIIGYGGEVAIKLKELLGENPFGLTKDEIKDLKRK